MCVLGACHPLPTEGLMNEEMTELSKHNLPAIQNYMALFKWMNVYDSDEIIGLVYILLALI